MSPNLFLLGAGKSGTTSLHHIFSQFPDIHVTTPKEPSFFCSYFQVVKDPISYFKLFDSDSRWRCDSSHVYLSNPESAPIIRELFPNARFILILRDPIQRAFSLYQHQRRVRHADGRPLELIGDFLSALHEEEKRLQDPLFLKHCRQYYWNFMYAESSRYDLQLERYLNIFPREQFMITTLFELAATPIRCLEKIAAFLNLDAMPENLNLTPMNTAPKSAEICNSSRFFLENKLAGVTERTENLLGLQLDWTL